MRKAVLRIVLGATLVLGLFSMPSPPLDAIYNPCFRCGAVVIPDPTGGPGWEDETCLATVGTAMGCIETWPAGGGCMLVNEGDCD